MKIAIVSLGCPKNQVDADVFCRALLEAGHQTVPDAAQADVVIVNTCGFIESAKLEAIETILDACAYKHENSALRVVVTGCLAERYRAEVAAEMPEVDAVVGIGANAALPEIVRRVCATPGEDAPGAAPLECYGDKTALSIDAPRVISTPAHYAWLKIAEGCSNACAYCAIPAIRGPLRSRPMDGILAEARWLAQQGVREVVLVAQDVTAYGDDGGKNRLVPLLQALEAVDGLKWIRLLYTYPERITQELLQTMRQSEKIVPYLDLPVQHCDEDILRSMGRRGGAEAVRRAVALIRAELPGATLRTSLIAGYPGETEAQFEALCDFVREVRFDRLGCFAYSPEEGTRAAALPGQLPEEERARRADIIMRLQADIMAEKQRAMVGQVIEVVCDGYDADESALLCRGAADAPEIDANVLIDAADGVDGLLELGSFARVRVVAAEDCDLWAKPVDDDGNDL